MAGCLTPRFFMRAGWLVVVFNENDEKRKKKKKKLKKSLTQELVLPSFWVRLSSLLPQAGQNSHPCGIGVQTMRVQLIVSFLFAFAKVSIVQFLFLFPASAEGYILVTCSGNFTYRWYILPFVDLFLIISMGTMFCYPQAKPMSEQPRCMVVSVKPPLQKL